MKGRYLVVVLCAIAVAGIGAVILLHRSRPRSRAGSHGARGVTPRAPAQPAKLNKAAYNAKLLALANLPPPCGTPPAAAAAKTRQVPAEIRPASYVRKKPSPLPCRAPLWPVHAVYPEAGALLPFKRIVAYYGNFYSARMGILGEFPPDQVLAKLRAAAAEWAKADPSTPVVPAVDYIVVSAQGAPMKDGKYRMRMPTSHIEKAVRMAEQIHGLLFLDVQPGWSTVQAELPRLEPYLKRPNAQLALDPEFALRDGKRPGGWVGTLSASDINFAARFLARIVRENQLPPKILVVHRFTERMVTDFRAIKPLPEVQIVMDMDGFGSPVLKRSTYRSYIASQPVQFTGFKLFYKNDVKIGGHLMSPAEVLRLSPQPSYIMYQ